MSERSRFAIRFAGNVMEIDCADARCEALLAASFQDMRSEAPPTIADRFELGRDADRGFELRAGGRLLVHGEAGPTVQMLTAHCLDRFARHCTDGLLFHAAAIAKGGRALLLPAASGAGKTTLAAWLCSRGFSLLSDEAVFLPEGGGLEPFRRFLDVKAAGRDAFRGWLDLEGDPRVLAVPEGYLIPPDVVSHGEPNRSAALAAIVFTRYEAGAEVEFEAISPARAALWSIGALANAPNLPDHGFRAVARLARTAPAYALRYGSLEDVWGRFDGILLRVA